MKCMLGATCRLVVDIHVELDEVELLHRVMLEEFEVDAQRVVVVVLDILGDVEQKRTNLIIEQRDIGAHPRIT